MNAPAVNLGEGGGRAEVQANLTMQRASSAIGAAPPPPPTPVALAVAARDVTALTNALRQLLMLNAANIPTELRAIKGWVCWRVTAIEATGKFNKIPIYPRTRQNRCGEQGSVADRENLGTLDDAGTAFMADSSLAGVGLAMLPDWNLTAFDADRCVEQGTVRKDVTALTDGAYCEISPSGTGIRAFWRGTARNGKNNTAGYELYASKQFVTVTGNVVSRPTGGGLTELDAARRFALETQCAAVGTTGGMSTSERLDAAASADPLLQAIRAKGLYERSMGNGKHSIRCPFEDQHSDYGRPGGDGDTVYMQPNTGGYTSGHFHCSHTHESSQADYWAAVGYSPFAAAGLNGLSQIPRDPTSADPDPVASLERNIVPMGSVMDQVNCFMPHVVDMLIPEDEVTLLAGHGGGGKSYVAENIAVHVALGRQFGNLPTKQTNVLFFSGEDGAQVLRQRLARICRALNIEPPQLEGKLHLLDASDIDPALHRERRVGPYGFQQTVTETPLLDTLALLVKKLDVGLVVIDNASDTYDGDEIKRASVRAFVRSLRQRIARPGRAVLLLAHINKESAKAGKTASSEDYSGSTAWHNSVRSRLSLTPDGDDALRIEHAKANYGLKAAPIRLEWRAGVPLVSDSLTGAGVAAAQAAEAIRTTADKAALVKLIQDFDKRGELVNTATQGPYSTFRQVMRVQGFPKNTDSDRLANLLRELEAEGRIYRRTVTTPNRKKKEVFTCLPAPGSAPIPVVETAPTDNEQEEACAE